MVNSTVTDFFFQVNYILFYKTKDSLKQITYKSKSIHLQSSIK